jgi:EmrB/QacA subfamily drug resistance transporter
MTDPSTRSSSSGGAAYQDTGTLGTGAAASVRRTNPRERSPWPALWALVIGFFMILVDTTIVSVANPAIKAALDPDTNNLDNVVWVTSAYLLAYAVPLLITGRLGDRFGPKRVYLVGLVVFTLASLWCGFSGTLEMLIVARAMQGLGAALMTPQTMAVITRTFPPDRRGAAMGLWGATAGVATLVGPLAGGLLVDGFGWEWIFFINVPVGIVAFVMAWVFVPNLPTHPHRFDMLGVVLSAVGLFLIVFGLQEGEHYDWGVIWGPITVWMLIIAGVIVMGVFIWTQARTKNEPLVPLELFKERNFAISNLAIATVGFTVTSMSLPLMFYIQLARGLTPTQAALLLIPMALLTGVLAPFAGKLLDRTDPRFLLVPGLLLVSGSLAWYASLMSADTPIWMFLLPSAMMGIGNAGMWGPLATTATRNLPMSQAGAGAGIYNTTRTVGSVIGSAAIAAFMQSRLEANLPGAGDAAEGFEGGTLPDFVVDGFSTAMAQAILLPAATLLIGVVAVLFLRRPRASGDAEWHAANAALAAEAATRDSAGKAD